MTRQFIYTIAIAAFFAISTLPNVSSFVPSSTTSTQKTTTTFSSDPRHILPRRSSICSTALQQSSSSSSGQTCDVAVIGGGFGGLYTALALARQQPKTQITLVDPSDSFVFLPLLYDLTVGTASEREVCPKYTDLLQGTNIQHVKGSLDSFCKDDLTSVNIKINHKYDETNTLTKLKFQRCVLAVGATPEQMLQQVPGALGHVQPFYTQKDASATRDLLFKLERKVSRGQDVKIAIVGGGYGGVELAACVKRRIPASTVALLTRGPPMKGTRAEPLIQKALDRLGVQIELASVQAIEKVLGEDDDDKFQIQYEEQSPGEDTQTTWDAILWTAGSGPAYPLAECNIPSLSQDGTGRVLVDSSMRCQWKEDSASKKLPPIWSLGDCTTILADTIAGATTAAAPKTAQAAMQQADVVAYNVLADAQGKSPKIFAYQDLGSMLTLGGPNAALMAPSDNSMLGPIFTPLLDTVRVGLGVADGIVNTLNQSPLAEKSGVAPTLEKLGLSFGGYGLGVDTNDAPGTLAGTLTGAARRAVYAVRMPTNQQRAYSVASAAISTAISLAKEATENNGSKTNKK